MTSDRAPDAFKFETGYATHAGKIRSVNEDNYFVNGEQGIWVVADGMGGHSDGIVASAAIVGSMATVGNPASAPDLMARFTDRILRVNQQLVQMNGGDDNRVVGATIVSLLIFGNHFACVWAGDSRAYLVRNGSISQLSHDHSEVQELLDKGVITEIEAKTWPRRNVVTRAIGVSDDLDLDSKKGKIASGDKFLLCSDGLTGHVEESEILDHVATVQAQQACDALVELTLQRGATDNVTVVVLHCMSRHGGVADEWAI